MLRVYKYPLSLVEDQFLTMPRRAELLDVQFQSGAYVLWARVDDQYGQVSRRIFVCGTGHPAPPGPYIATVQANGGAFVWHFFDGGED